MSIRDEIAAELDGTEYPVRVCKELNERAKQAGVVIVYGASDDLMEFNGAIHDEVGCYDGGTAHLTKDGLLQNECDDKDCPHFAKLKGSAATIEAVWDDGEYSWTYKTNIPHVTFEVVEDGEKYCRGHSVQPRGHPAMTDMHREAFERSIRLEYKNFDSIEAFELDEDGDYYDEALIDMWRGWQAALRYRDEPSDEVMEMQRKARCWDDLGRAKAEASRIPDNSSWKEVARRQGLISGVKACRAAHGFSLMEARDCVETYLRDEQEKQA